jgi:hypothetical protein
MSNPYTVSVLSLRIGQNVNTLWTTLFRYVYHISTLPHVMHTFTLPIVTVVFGMCD